MFFKEKKSIVIAPPLIPGFIGVAWDEAKKGFQTAFEKTSKIETSVDGRIESDILNEESDKIFKETGERLDLTYPKALPGLEQVPVIGDIAKAGRQILTDETRKSNEEALKNIQAKSPDFALPSADSISEQTKVRAKEIDEAADKFSVEAGFSGTAGQFAGAVAGSLTDPVIVATTLATGPLVGLGKIALGKVMLREAVINAGVELPLQTELIQPRRESLGLESGIDRAIEATIAVGVGGAVLTGGIGAAIASPKIIAGDLRGFVDTFLGAKPKPTAAERQAAHEITKAAHLEDANVIGSPSGDRSVHHNRAEKIWDGLENDAPVQDFAPTPLRSDVDPQNSMLPAEDISALSVDPKTFQFKSNTDALGVKRGPESLEGVTEWNQDLAGVVSVFESIDGTRTIADGHQRVGLAKRIKAQDPSVKTNAYTQTYRESDGFTPERVRTLAAAKNIAQGTGSIIDAAKVLRVKPEDLPPLPPKSSLFRDAQGMTQLSDEAFMVSINEIIEPRFAARVGEIVKDKTKHVAIIDAMSKSPPNNLTQAESFIRDLDATDFTEVIENDLFGENVLKHSLFQERAQVLDSAMKEIKKNKKLFQSILDNERAIVKTGDNVLDANSNRAVADGMSMAYETINKLAHQKGDVSDALTAAAKAAKQTGDTAAAAREFTREVQRSIDEGSLSREDVGRSRGLNNAPKEAGVRTSAQEEVKSFTAEVDNAISRVDAGEEAITIGADRIPLTEQVPTGATIEGEVEFKSLNELIDEARQSKDVIARIDKLDITEDTLLEAGISPKQVKEIRDLDDTIKRDLKGEGLSEVQIEAESKARLKKGLESQSETLSNKLFNNVAVNQRIRNDFQNYDDMFGNDPRDLGQKMIDMLDHDGVNPITSWQRRYDNVKGQAHRMMADSLDRFATKAAGVYNPATGKAMGFVPVKERTGVDEAMHELFGTDTGNQAAKELAQSFGQVSDFLNKRAKNAGVDIPELSDWKLPNPPHSAQKIFKTGEAEYVQDLMEQLDWDKMTRPHSGTKIAPEDRTKILGEVYGTLISDGKNKFKFKKSTLADNMKDGRFLKFKGSDGYLKYLKKYTEANPFEVMVDHMDKMSRRISMIETFGPDPLATKAWMKANARKEAADQTRAQGKDFQTKLEKKLLRFDAMFDRAGDFGNLTENIPSQVVATAQNLIAPAWLDKTVLTAAPTDLAKSATAMGRLTPSASLMNEYLRQLNPLSSADKKLASEAGLINELVDLDTNASARWIGEVAGPRWTRRYANTAMRLNFLSPHTQALKKGFSLEFMGSLAKSRDKSFDQMEPFFKKTMNEAGISAKDWDVYRQMDPHVEERGFGKAEFMMPSKFREQKFVNPEKANEIADKFMHMINDKRAFGVIDSNLRAQTFFLGGAAPGSVPGILSRSFSFLKTFPVTMTRQLVHDIGREKTLKGKIKTGARTQAALLVSGGVAAQMLNIASGRDPESIYTEEFFAESLKRGGGMGVGDFAFEGLNRFGSGLEGEIAGPVFGVADDFIELTMGNMKKAFADKKIPEEPSVVDVSGVEKAQLEEKLLAEFPEAQITEQNGRLTIHVPGMSATDVQGVINAEFQVKEKDLGEVLKKGDISLVQAKNIDKKELKEFLKERFDADVDFKELKTKFKFQIKGQDSNEVLDAINQEFGLDVGAGNIRKLGEADFKKFGFDPKQLIKGKPATIVETEAAETTFMRDAAKFATRNVLSGINPFIGLALERNVMDALRQSSDSKNAQENWDKDAKDRFLNRGQTYFWDKGGKKPLRLPRLSDMFQTPEQLQKEKEFEFSRRGAPKKERRRRSKRQRVEDGT